MGGIIYFNTLFLPEMFVLNVFAFSGICNSYDKLVTGLCVV